MAADQISFARGAPSLDIVDVEGLKAAAVAAFEADPAGVTAYGTSVGYPPLRKWLADRYEVEPENVLITNGSMQAGAFLFDTLVGDGTAVVVERPTYDRTLLGLKARGAEIHTVDLDSEGIIVESLEELLKSGLRPALVHVIPNFHNPAGCTLPLDRRTRLVELAREYGFVLFEDDPYRDVRFEGEQLPSMLEIDRSMGGDVGSVIHACSFTKTVCPGVRVGWLVGESKLIEPIRNLATGTYIAPGMVAQGLVHQFVLSGAFDRSIASVSKALGERATALGAALASALPTAESTLPRGGYCRWLGIPGANGVELAAAAAEQGVAIVPGSDFMAEGGEEFVRLAYSAASVPEIEKGVRRLAAAARELGIG
ncbi:MAG: PLP-dependent aminotransferase family protein [Actinomycetes bacterium]